MGDNQLLLRKSLTTADLPYGSARMNRTQADRFIDFTKSERVMLAGDMARIETVDNPLGRISRMAFTGPVLEKADENTDSGNVFKPAYTYLDYSTQKTRSAVDLTMETLEENIEGASHQDSIMRSLAIKIGENVEQLDILGDATAYAAVNTDLGRLLRCYDGWYKLSQSGHVVDLLGTTISKDVFGKLLRALPNVYKQQRQLLRYLCSPNIVQDYREMLASRNTDYGDVSLQGNGQITVYGIPIIEVPLIPENLNSFDGSQSWGDASFIWLTNPKNFIHIYSRLWEIFFQQIPRKDAIEITVYSRMGAMLENNDAIVLGTNVRTLT